MHNWMSTRVLGALVTGLLAGGVAVMGVSAIAAGPEALPAEPVGCAAPIEDFVLTIPEGSVSFGPLHPQAE